MDDSLPMDARMMARAEGVLVALRPFVGASFDEIVSAWDRHSMMPLRVARALVGREAALREPKERAG